ncbi:hypothetical protein GCM10008096_15940 [Zhihengliuella salsuginis]|uniref:Uncharacterized protein n=1 Tax=Zhihengliuella salsuginis TaxID=578222 RepID=A0ABQ3GHP6_9MICC|nr:hypothetical protein GCM10008096_15940 [Zhihengliuella salsuginis]
MVVLTSQFYADYNRDGEQVTVAAPHGSVIATYAKPAARAGRHGPTEPRPSTRS